MKKKVLILGSTGSIGVNTCSVIREFSNDFEIVGLSTNTKIDELLNQIKEFKPKYVHITDNDALLDIKNKNIDDTIIYNDSISNFVRDIDFDILVNALVGYSGFLPTIEAIKKSKIIALANKETLVVGGEIINNLLKEYNSSLIPIDSEHSAIFQILKHFDSTNNYKSVEKLILTASGGPFFKTPIEDFSKITVEEALKHPTWSMGSKITIDSATMMNKGFEVIEAHYLFNMPYEKIETIIHPQSLIHSMVEFIDGEIYAQIGKNDMRLPIQHALTFPEIRNTPFEKLKLYEHSELNFYKMDFDKFVMLKYAYECGNKGGLYPCVLNAVNEICVYSFLSKKIKFTDIFTIVREAININIDLSLTIENIIKMDKLVREETIKKIG